MFILTERLIIRPFEMKDLPEFKKLLTIREVPGWVKQKKRAEDFLKWQIANYAEMNITTASVCLGIFERESKIILGAAGAGEHDDLHETEIFYNLLQSARGKGYATEAAKAVTDWAFQNYRLNYLIGTVKVDNIDSQKVLERCGYRYINQQTLLVHIENKKYDFKYYRCNPPRPGDL